MNKTTGDCIYIGSSFEIMKRVYSHVYNSLHSCDKPLYQYIIDNGGWDVFEFVIFQEYTNVNREFLLSKEREYIELYKPRYNFRPVGISNWHFLNLKVYLYINIIWNFLKMKP